MFDDEPDMAAFHDWAALSPEPTTPLARAKAAIRGEGWTVTGRRRCGYIVSQGNVRHKMGVAMLLAFAGIDG